MNLQAARLDVGSAGNEPEAQRSTLVLCRVYGTTLTLLKPAGSASGCGFSRQGAQGEARADGAKGRELVPERGGRADRHGGVCRRSGGPRRLRCCEGGAGVGVTQRAAERAGVHPGNAGTAHSHLSPQFISSLLTSLYRPAGATFSSISLHSERRLGYCIVHSVWGGGVC
jgi:hypothetical protein